MKLLLVILFSFFTVISYSQEKEVEIVVNLKNDDTGKKLSGATVSIYADGKLITAKSSESNGKVPTIYLETGKYYQIFIRKSGFVSKMAELDTRVDNLEDAPPALFLRFETALFESVEGVDFNFLEKTPMTKFDFDEGYYQRHDKGYTDKMLKQIEELKRKIAEKKEEESKQDKASRKTEADFNAYVEAGDAAIKSTKYEKAISQYELALALKKDHIGVQNKLKEAKRLLKESKKGAELEAQYQKKMGEANIANSSEKWLDAINLYTEASALKPNEQEPKTRIDEIRKKIADAKVLEEKVNTLVKIGRAHV